MASRSRALPEVLWRRRSLVLAGAALACPVRAQAQREPLPVLFPEIGEPYRSVFAKILDGIDEVLPTRSERIAVPAGADGVQLGAELQRRRPRVVIALGRAGLRVAQGLEAQVDVVGGGVIGPGEGDQRATALLCLSPDPGLLLTRLRSLQPATRRVTVVYSARHSAWLIRLAQDAARQQGLELRALEVEDLKQALRQYQDFFAQAGAQDALWLPQDPVAVDEGAVLPLVLQESWNRNVPLFSSNLAHVRRGALFALYPHNEALGRSLGALALAHLNRGANAARGSLPLRDVQAALNTRTASHLGVNLSPQLQRGFELLLPER